MIGGMVGQILIQAAVLRMILFWVARHEADTTFPKAAMVTAGITLGNMLVAMLMSGFSPWLTILAQLALMTAMLVSFCWVSPWKSVLVVIVFASTQFLTAFLIELLLTAMFKPLTISNPISPGFTNEQRTVAVPSSFPRAVDVHAESQRLKAQSDAKRAEMEARIREMEEVAGLPPPVVPPSETLPVVSIQPVPSLPQKKIVDSLPSATRAHDAGWVQARKTIKIGGVMSGRSGYLAMVNGVPVEAGDTVSATYNGLRYRWTVASVTKNHVDLKPLDAVPER